MAESDRIHVDVAVALVTDQNQHVLLTLNESWGAFTLPMTRRRRSVESNEQPARAALRAAVEVLGVPVRLVEEGPRRLMGRLVSERQQVDKVYTYKVYHVEPHPDFVDRVQIRQPHLWLSPHLILSGVYEPISESARFILRGVLTDFKIPTRNQHTSVLIFQRQSPERGREFLVRWNPEWGYTLPAKRGGVSDPAVPEDQAAAALAAAARVASEELGLEPGTDVIISPAKSPVYTTHGVSARKDAPAFGSPTDYVHSLFDTELHHPEKLRSDRPLAWVTEEDVHCGWTTGSQGEPGALQDRSGRVSRTTYEILLHLGLIAEFIVLES
jgi:hypothetical protein